MDNEAFDIVGNLPTEIGEKIFGYLRGCDLCKCTLVNRKWNLLSSKSFLWRRVLELEYPEELKYLSDVRKDGLDIYRECYKRAVRSVKKWKSNNYWTLETQAVAKAFYLGNGAILALIKNDSSITLYDLNKGGGKAEVIQELEPFSEPAVEYSELKIFLSDKLIVILKTNNREDYENLGSSIHTFIWESDKLYKKEIFNTRGDQANNWPPLLESGMFPPSIIFVGIIGDSFLFYNTSDNTDYFCNGSKVLAKLKRSPVSESARVYCHIYKDTYFLHASKMYCYGPNGEEKMNLDFSIIKNDMIYGVDIKCNPDIILIEVISKNRKAVAWLWKDPKRRLPTVLESRNTFFLHPTGRNVSYFSQRNSFDDCEVITVAMDTGNIMSVVPFRLDLGTYTSFFSGNFSLIYDRFCLLVPTLSHPLAGNGEFLLMDLRTGETLFQEPFNRFMIIFANNKVLESYYVMRTSCVYKLRVYT